ncbi:unnamed protein product [Brassica rapa]|uniref:Uncharacterized protein n=1 Tax=Brassica campestris TaxID=3711 RepID=A0A3P6AQI1_BRACM|nr:unnamed protein product [Brassica rapa]VDC96156.1 unnamed protein product [Brassica rapa]
MKIVGDVESIVVLQHFSNTDGDENCWGQNRIIIFKILYFPCGSFSIILFLVVNPHKRCLFGLGTTQMENNYHIDPPARPSYLSISFRELTALCEARGTTNSSPSSPPSTNEQRI